MTHLQDKVDIIWIFKIVIELAKVEKQIFIVTIFITIIISWEWVWSHNLHKGQAIQRAHYPFNHHDNHKERDNSYFLAALTSTFLHFKSTVHPALASRGFYEARISS